MNRIRVAVVAVALSLAAGCGGSAGTPKADPSPAPSSPTGSATPSASPSPAEDATPQARTPLGWRTVTAKKSGLRFALPKAWTRLDATRLKDPAFKPTLERFADSIGVTPDQLAQIWAQIDLMAISPTLDLQDYAEVEVVPVPMVAEFPTRESLRAQFATLKGIRVLGFRDVPTPVGNGLVTSISKLVPDHGRVFSQAVFVQLESGVVGVTVTAPTALRARQLSEKMIRSFRDAGRGGAVGNGSAVDG